MVLEWLLADYFQVPTSRPLNTMKILHVLVGYLTVTAPLPFHLRLFAVASPLAATIDYDGYVNITQSHALMKHALDSTVETCQTVTTQDHGDSALIKRVPGDILEPRQGPLVLPAVALILFLIGDVVIGLVWIADDNPVRGDDAEFFVGHFD